MVYSPRLIFLFSLLPSFPHELYPERLWRVSSKPSYFLFFLLALWWTGHFCRIKEGLMDVSPSSTTVLSDLLLTWLCVNSKGLFTICWTAAFNARCSWISSISLEHRFWAEVGTSCPWANILHTSTIVSVLETKNDYYLKW